MPRSIKDLSFIGFATLILTFAIWLPHILSIKDLFGLNFSNGFNTIYRNYDGIEYIIIAKTGYLDPLISKLPQALPGIYFSAHFPGYALAIYLFSGLFGYLKSMLIVSLLSTVFATYAFFRLIKDFNLSKSPMILAIISLVLPARWLVVHSVGSAEPLFALFLILSFYFFLKFEQTQSFRHIFSSALFGVLLVFTRPPGILLFISMAFYALYQIFANYHPKSLVHDIILQIKKYFILSLIPLTLLGIFCYYGYAYSDFWAYFHSGDNIHLSLPPFQVFNSHQPWVGEIWLEDVVYIFLIAMTAVLYLFQKKLKPMAFFVATYLFATMLVAHRDIARYSLPIFPFILIAFESLLTRKDFRIVFIILSIAIYFYAQNFILGNTAPYPNPQLFN